jgi:hypothetical protein
VTVTSVIAIAMNGSISINNTETAFTSFFESLIFHVINIHVTKMSMLPPIQATAGVGRVKNEQMLCSSNRRTHITVLAIARCFVVVRGILIFIRYSV